MRNGDQACSDMHPVLQDVAAALGDKARVIKIDIEKTRNFLKPCGWKIAYFDDLQRWRDEMAPK